MTVMRWTKCSKKQIALKHISWLSITNQNTIYTQQHSNKNCSEEDKEPSILDRNVSSQP